MRTTLNIDDDILAGARELARQQNLPTGVIVSRLLRQSLVGNTGKTGAAATSRTVAGFRPFPARGRPVDDERIDRLRDEEGI